LFRILFRLETISCRYVTVRLLPAVISLFHSNVWSAIVLTVLVSVPAFGQDSAAASAERTLSSGVYTAAQAGRGEGVYKMSCQSCHAKTEYTGDTFKVAWVSKTVFDVFDQIRSQMPEDNPGSLERQQYIDVVAYIFSLNAYPTGANEMPGDDAGLKKIRIDNPPASTASSTTRILKHPRVTLRK
jgi:hypothetical protein